MSSALQRVLNRVRNSKTQDVEDSKRFLLATRNIASCASTLKFQQVRPDLDVRAFAVGLPDAVINLSGKFRRNRCLWIFPAYSTDMRIFGNNFCY